MRVALTRKIGCYRLLNEINELVMVGK